MKKSDNVFRFQMIVGAIILIIIFGVVISVILFSDYSINNEEDIDIMNCGNTTLDNDDPSTQYTVEYVCFKTAIENCIPAKLVAYKVQISETVILEVLKEEEGYCYWSETTLGKNDTAINCLIEDSTERYRVIQACPIEKSFNSSELEKIGIDIPKS